MRQVTLGIIGLGEVAQLLHLPALTGLADRFAIGAICDRSPGLLASVGDKYRIERRFTDAADLVAQSDLDAVLVLGNDEYHADLTIAAATHGKHVLVEKPICMTLREVDEIIAARDRAGVQVMVAYMRRFAPAFVQAVDEVTRLPKINFARVRDIIGPNRLFIDQSSAIFRFDDIPADARRDRQDRAARLLHEAIGDVPADVATAYRVLLGLSSHDLSAMREIIGVPNRVVAARQWNGGRFITALLEYDGYQAVFETGIDQQARFDASIEVFGDTRTIRVDYDTPYIRHLPTTLTIQDTENGAFTESVIRPTFKDPFTCELEAFHEVVTGAASPKTPPEDARHDLQLMLDIVKAFGR